MSETKRERAEKYFDESDKGAGPNSGLMADVLRVTDRLTRAQIAELRFDPTDDGADLFPEAGSWRVHVTGPDEYLPAEGQLDAILQANAINAGAAITAADANPYAPFVWATPERIDQ